MSRPTVALLPAALVALLVFWCGSFHGAASAPGALAHPTAVLLFCLLIPSVSDPLDLGGGRWLPVALVATVALSWGLSPVDRAGLVGLTLLPAYLLLPSCAARCWREPRSQRVGLLSLSLLTLLVGLTSLISQQALSLSRAALPLGHHNLLSGWMVLILPLTLAAVRFAGPARWLALGAGATGLLALTATGSLLGILAITVQAIIAAFWWRRLRFWLVPVVLILGALVLPRLLSIAQSSDLSALARLSYVGAGWQGIRARPALGWGPGSVPWTVGEFIHPSAGIHPASQIVADLHSLPLQIAYETGVGGILVTAALTLFFILRRWREIAGAEQTVTRRAALLGLLGGVVFALGSAPLAVPALPATAAVVAGMTLQTRAPILERLRFPYLLVYLLLAASVLVPLSKAHFLYDAARHASSPTEGLRYITRAREADPEFPLYLARGAWLASEIRGADDVVAEQALQAAKMAPGLAPLWLAAGDLGQRAGLPWAPSALSRARGLDPLSPLVLFHLMTVLPGESDVALRTAEAALTAEPRLKAAQWWWDHPETAERFSRQIGVPIPQPLESPDPRSVVLALTLDRDPAVSFSLFAFRRSPWPGRLAPVPMVVGDRSTFPNTSHP